MLLKEIKKYISTFFKKTAESTELIPDEKKDINRHYLLPGIYITETVTFGRDEIVYVDENRGIRKIIVDANGIINNFPSVIKEDFWMRRLKSKEILPKVRFRTVLGKRVDEWRMLWEIQPDGRYWGDDSGFGVESDEEIVLYTYLDSNGDFTGPFRVYSVGNETYFEK